MIITMAASTMSTVRVAVASEDRVAVAVMVGATVRAASVTRARTASAVVAGVTVRLAVDSLTDAAVAVGGFLGFGLSSMPVAMATMDEVSRRYGPSPKAFLLITLAGSFFVDLANAFIAKGVLSLPFFAISPVAAGG